MDVTAEENEEPEIHSNVYISWKEIMVAVELNFSSEITQVKGLKKERWTLSQSCVWRYAVLLQLNVSELVCYFICARSCCSFSSIFQLSISY